jgi:hypothetical protein
MYSLKYFGWNFLTFFQTPSDRPAFFSSLPSFLIYFYIFLTVKIVAYMWIGLKLGIMELRILKYSAENNSVLLNPLS